MQTVKSMIYNHISLHLAINGVSLPRLINRLDKFLPYSVEAHLVKLETKRSTRAILNETNIFDVI